MSTGLYSWTSFLATVLVPAAEATEADPRSVLLIYGEVGPVPAIASFDRGINDARAAAMLCLGAPTRRGRSHGMN